MHSGLEFPQAESKDQEDAWKKHFKNIEKWLQAAPNSISARVALAQSWINYGGAARGPRYAHTLTPENRRLYLERNQKALDILLDAEALGEKYPEWYVAMLEVAKAQGWDRSTYNSYYEKGFQLEPTYYPLHTQKVNFLLPR